MKRVQALVLVASTLFAGVAADATVIKRLSLEEVESHAAQIFVGTVRLTESVDGGPPKNLIMTDVTFENLEVLKGEISGSTVEYRFAGGSIGERTLTVVGVPEFEVGRKYVLFANADLDWICPAVGWWQGRYTVKSELETGVEILCDSDGRPVFGFAKGQPVLDPAKKGDRPIRLSAFLADVKKLVKRHEEELEPARTHGAEPEKKPGERPGSER